MDSEVENEGIIFRIEENGGLDWFLKVSGGHPLRTMKPSDSCHGLTYNSERGELAAVIQTYAPEFRLFNVGDYYDTMLLLTTARGDVSRALTVSNNVDGLDMFSFSGNLYQDGDRWFLGGSQPGFATRRQVFQEFGDDVNTDTFMMRLEFGKGQGSDYNCLYQGKLSSRGVRSQTEFFQTASAAEQYELLSRDEDVPKSEMGTRYLYAYYSQFPSSLYLRSGLNTPRPCAYTSIELDTLEYFRAAEPLEYDIRKGTNFDYVLTQMDFTEGKTTIFDQHGAGESESQNANFTKDGLFTF